MGTHIYVYSYVQTSKTGSVSSAVVFGIQSEILKHKNKVIMYNYYYT